MSTGEDELPGRETPPHAGDSAEPGQTHGQVRAPYAEPGQAGSQSRPLRADARRNRDRVLAAAFAAFAAEGLSVPVHEIARRAGVGTGTVSRHFPTKESLFAAVFMSRVEWLAGLARDLGEAADAGDAFFRFFAALVAEGAANRGLADALTGAGFDIKAAAAGPDHDIASALAGLLARAQQAGAVRPDIGPADVLALVSGCLARQPDPDDPAVRDRLVAVVCAGMRRDG